MKAPAHIGTSGFYYEHWRGVLYPEDRLKSRWFEAYARAFDTVEMNSTLYRLPKAKTIEHWDEKSPERFLFAFKAPRGIIHYKKLKETWEELLRFLHLLKPIKPKLAADFVYLRLHGPDGHYGGSYDDAALRLWAERIRREQAHHRPAFVYFNNDFEGNAVKDARRLKELVDAD